MVAKTTRELTADTSPAPTRVIPTWEPTGVAEPLKSTIAELMVEAGAAIKTAYEANADTNAFLDAEKTRLERGTIVATAIQTSAYAAVTGDLVLTDSTGAAFIVTLPATPSVGDVVGILDVTAQWATNNVTVARNATNIEGAASDLVLDGGRYAELRYSGASRGWVLNFVSNAAQYEHPNHTGDVTSTGDGATAIAAGVIVDADVNASAAIALSKLATQAALSVVANATNDVAVPTALAAASDHQVLRRSGTAVAFGTVATDGIAASAVTNAKLANMDAGRVKMRTTAGAGDPEDIEIADAAAVRSAAVGRPLVAANIEAASAIETLTDAATIAVDWDAFINAQVTLAGNRTLGLPSAGQPGTWRRIAVIQDGTGSRTLALAAGYVTVGGAALTLTTEAGSIDVLSIFCRTASIFEVFSALDMKAPA